MRAIPLLTSLAFTSFFAVSLCPSEALALPFKQGEGPSISSPFKSKKSKATPEIPTFEDQGITSTAHGQHAGQIVFATEYIPFKGEDPSSFRDTFQATDPLYGRIYLSQSMGNTPTVFLWDEGEPTLTSAEDIDTYYAIVTINGEVVVPDASIGPMVGLTANRGWFYEGQVPEGEGQRWTSWRFDLSPPPDYDGIDPLLNNAWASRVNQLPIGSHDVTIELWSGDQTERSVEPIARGAFTLKKTSDKKLAGTDSFPKSVYAEADASAVRAQVKRSLVATGVFGSTAEIRKISIVTPAMAGRFTDTLQDYQRIGVTVLFGDDNADGLCSFSTLHFLRRYSGNRWTSFEREASYCNGPYCYQGTLACED